MAGMPTPRTPFEEDDLIAADAMREIQQAREQRNCPQTTAPPQQPAAPADAPVWLTFMERMFDRQGQRMEGLLSAQDRRISMLAGTLVDSEKETKQDAELRGDVREETQHRRCGPEPEAGRGYHQGG